MDRTIYSPGQLLTAADLQRDQDFHSARLRQAGAAMLTPGVVNGMNVSEGPADKQILIEPGIAIDANGQWLVLDENAQFNGVKVTKQGPDLLIDLSQISLDDYPKSRWLTVSYDSLSVAAAGGVSAHGTDRAKLTVQEFLPDSTPGDDGTFDPALPLAQLDFAIQPASTDGGRVLTVTQCQDGATFALNLMPDLLADLVENGQISSDMLPPLTAEMIPDLSADKVTSGTLAAARLPALTADLIPNLDASKIVTGTLPEAVLPVLTADKIPDLDASKIKTGMLPDAVMPALTAAKIPDLDASKITTGTLPWAVLPELMADKIPDLDASKIVSGLLDLNRLPQIPADKITGLPTAPVAPPVTPPAAPTTAGEFIFYTNTPLIPYDYAPANLFWQVPADCAVELTYAWPATAKGRNTMSLATDRGELSGNSYSTLVDRMTVFTLTAKRFGQVVFQQQIVVDIVREAFEDVGSDKPFLNNRRTRQMVKALANLFNVIESGQYSSGMLNAQPWFTDWMVQFADPSFFDNNVQRFREKLQPASETNFPDIYLFIKQIMRLLCANVSEWNALMAVAPGDMRARLDTMASDLHFIGQDNPENIVRFNNISDIIYKFSYFPAENMEKSYIQNNQTFFDAVMNAVK